MFNAYDMGYNFGLTKRAIDPRLITTALGGLAGGLVGRISEDPLAPRGSGVKIEEREDPEGKIKRVLMRRSALEDVPGWVVGALAGSGLGAGMGQLIHTAAQERSKG